MKTLFIKLILASIYLSLCVLSLRINITRGFKGNCNEIELNKSVLSAKCQNLKGDYASTSVNLNKCIGNRDGVMFAGWTDFYGTSRNCKLDKTILSCELKDAKGYRWPKSYFDLNDFVANEYGKLECKIRWGGFYATTD
jgi:hypothetical protein